MKKKCLILLSFLLLCSCSKIEEIPPYYESSTDITDPFDVTQQDLSETEPDTSVSEEDTTVSEEVTTVSEEVTTVSEAPETVVIPEPAENTGSESSEASEVPPETASVITTESAAPVTTTTTAPFIVTTVTTTAPIPIITATTTTTQETVNTPLQITEATTTEATTAAPVWEEKNFEVYKPLKASSLLMDGETLAGSDFDINTDKTGSTTVTLDVKQNGQTVTVKRAVNITDTVKPVVLTGNATITVGTTFNINNIVSYADNYDTSPKISYTGNIDTNTIGSYPIKITVTDSSGNTLDYDMTVKVIELSGSGSYQDDPLYFSDFSAKHKTSNTSVGIDISKWQGDVDFNAVKNAGCEFVYMRLGVHTDSGYSVDEYFEQNYKNAKAAGLKVGVYFYSKARSPADIHRTVDFIRDNLSYKTIDLPIAFDWEDFSNFQKYKMSLHDINVLYSNFSSECAELGYKTILYSSKNRLYDVWDTDNTKVWLAHYTDRTDYTGSYYIWQCSQSGRIDGIYGAVDLDIMYK